MNNKILFSVTAEQFKNTCIALTLVGLCIAAITLAYHCGKDDAERSAQVEIAQITGEYEQRINELQEQTGQTKWHKLEDRISCKVEKAFSCRK